MSERYWAISAFEWSAEQLADAFVRSSPSDIRWMGIADRTYGDCLTVKISTPTWARSAYGAIGISGAWKKSLTYIRLTRYLLQAWCKYPIEGIVVVDFSTFHWYLLKQLKRALPNLKVIYLSPPEVWASRSGRLCWIREWVSRCVTVYSHDYKYYEACQLPCTLLKGLTTFSQVRIPVSNPSVSHPCAIPVLVYAGSRISKIMSHWAVVLRALRMLQKLGWQIPVYVSVPACYWGQRHQLYPGYDVTFFCEEMVPIRDPAIAWVASGTMTTRVAALGLPMIVMAYVHPITYVLLRKVSGYRGFFGRPNIEWGYEAYPEVIGPRFTAKHLVQTHMATVASWYHNPDHFVSLSQKWLTMVTHQGEEWASEVPRIFQQIM